jgi:enterochelin esterase-like enzyme
MTRIVAFLIAVFVGLHPAHAASRVVAVAISAPSLENNLISLSTQRRVKLYLPDGYDGSRRRYPVLYYLPTFFEDENAVFETHHAQAVLDAAIRDRILPPVIFITADFRTPTGAGWFVNSPVSGNWDDFVVRDLVPYVDSHYRTLASAASRGISGDRMGGYGAIRLGMAHPDVFGAVYALHPIGTGTGVQPMASRPNWALLARAKSIADLSADGFSLIFASIYQAHLPNPARPPLFFDPPAGLDGDQLTIDAAQTARLIANFPLASLVPAHAANLRRLRGLKFDWARGDTVQDHIYANQALTHILDEYGIMYEAEEYRGGWGERHWTADGRVRTDMLPFFARVLTFTE